MSNENFQNTNANKGMTYHLSYYHNLIKKHQFRRELGKNTKK